jgi:hypothetical protein
VVHTLRETARPSPAEYGYGLLRGDYTPKPAYCHFVGMAGGTYTGC